MKQLSIILFFIFGALMLLASCSNSDKQDDDQIACAAIYIFPRLNFQVINKATNTDLFFAPAPEYNVSDIKVYLKDGNNKIDSLLPVVNITGAQKYFTFSVKRAITKDTCFVKIKGLKADTLIYTIGNSNAPCPQPYINTVAVNKGSSLALAENAVLQIKK